MWNFKNSKILVIKFLFHCWMYNLLFYKIFLTSFTQKFYLNFVSKIWWKRNLQKHSLSAQIWSETWTYVVPPVIEFWKIWTKMASFYKLPINNAEITLRTNFKLLFRAKYEIIFHEITQARWSQVIVSQ